MPEKNFTKSFKNELKNCINKFFEDKKLPLIAITEFGKNRKLFAPDFGEKTVVDIGILSKNYENNKLFRLVAIEIEYISSNKQIQLNFKKLLNYAKRHKNPKPKIGLLHLIFWEAQISKKTLIELAKLPLTENKSEKFYYHLLLCDENLDKRKPAKFAEEVFNDWKFGVYFFSLAEAVFGKKIFNAQKLAKDMWWKS